MAQAASHFRRGFKSEAAALAKQIREELNLRPHDKLDPKALAEHLSIPLARLTDFRDGHGDAVRHLCEVDPSSFSAVTVFSGSARLIVYHDGHSAARQASSLTHELAHALLMHDPHVAVDPSTGCRVWNAQIEREADFLAGALLVTDLAAVRILRTGQSLAAAAAELGVSVDMIRYRLNVTGAYQRAGVSRRSR